MKFVHIFMISILALYILMAGCISQSSKSPQETPTLNLTTIKVAYQPTTSNGPIYIAMEEGYFADQGIQVELVKTPSTAASLPLLLQGDVAVSTGPMKVGLLNMVIQGGHIKIVADKGTLTPDSCYAYGIMVRKDLVDKGIVKSAADLKGLKIAGLDSDYELPNALALGNLTLDDIDFVNIEFTMISAAFTNGAIDAAMVSEPYVTQISNKDLAVMVIPAQEYIPGWPAPIYYGPAIIDKDQELGRRFMVAYLKGVRQFNEGKTERNLIIIENYTHLGREILNQTCWIEISPDGIQSPVPIRNYINWLYAHNKIRQNLSDAQLLDMSYVEYANTVLRNTTDGKNGQK